MAKKNDLKFMEQYLELAAGIVERAIKDYIQDGWWLNNHPIPTATSGNEFCVYNGRMNSFNDAKNWFHDPKGFVQEIFGGNDEAIQFLIENCERSIKIGKETFAITKKGENLDSFHNDDLFIILEAYQTNPKLLDPYFRDGYLKVKTVDKKILYQFILPLVNHARAAIGLGKIENLCD